MSVGIGIPGVISPATGLVKNANSIALNGHRFDHDMSVALDREVRVSSRPPSSSPSVGQHSRHVEELKGIISSAFSDVEGKAEEKY